MFVKIKIVIIFHHSAKGVEINPIKADCKEEESIIDNNLVTVLDPRKGIKLIK
jgi:hypothetical protein